MAKQQIDAIIHHGLVLLTLGTWYLLLRQPMTNLVLAYHDDAEAVYHTLCLLKGCRWYVDDYSHHFLGYVLQYALIALVRGFSPQLSAEVAFITHLLTAYGVFLCGRTLGFNRTALLAALLCLSARQPLVLGLFIQYQLNLLIIFILYYCLKFLAKPSPAQITIAGFLAGTLIIFDQRTLFLALIPFITTLIDQKSKKHHNYKSFKTMVILAMAIPPLGATVALWYWNAIQPFIEQTIIFPTIYRRGTHSLVETLALAIQLHRHLLITTPHLVFGGLLGLLAIILMLRKQLPDTHQSCQSEEPQGLQKSIDISQNPQQHSQPIPTIIQTANASAGETNKRHPVFLKGQAYLLLVMAIPLAVTAGLGGRDYDYYTIIWLPYLSLLSIIGIRLFREKTGAIYLFSLGLAVLLSGITAIKLAATTDFNNYHGDGIQEVAEYLDKQMTPKDTVLIFGYRLDLYIYLERLAAFPFANQIMIHADDVVISNEDRSKHAYPLYENRFLDLLSNTPPNFLVTYLGKNQPSSVSLSAVRKQIKQNYTLVYKQHKCDFRGKRQLFQVYKLKGSPSTS